VRRDQIESARSGPMPAGSPSVKAKGCTALLVQHDPHEGKFFRAR
jgi:hypothetical protein